MSPVMHVHVRSSVLVLMIERKWSLMLFWGEIVMASHSRYQESGYYGRKEARASQISLFSNRAGLVYYT